MTDQQKVQLLPCPFCGGQPVRGSSYDEDVLLHNIRCRCGAGVNDFFGPEGAIEAWNTRQAALAHASSATVKENLTVGEGEAVARKLRQWAARINNNGSYAERDLLLAAASMIEGRGPTSAEDERDAASWRELCRQIDASDPVSNEASTIRNIVDDAINLGSTCLVMHIDQALAAERGGGNG